MDAILSGSLPIRCGATSRVSNLTHAGFLIAFLWMGSSFVAHIPIPALAGVTAWMGLCLLDWSAWRRLPRMNRADAIAFLVTAISVLTVNAALAVAIGCGVYLFQRAAGNVPSPVAFDQT